MRIHLASLSVLSLLVMGCPSPSQDGASGEPLPPPPPSAGNSEDAIKYEKSPPRRAEEEAPKAVPSEESGASNPSSAIVVLGPGDAFRSTAPPKGAPGGTGASPPKVIEGGKPQGRTPPQPEPEPPQAQAPEPAAQGLDAWLASLPVEALVFNTPTEIQYEQKIELRLVVQPGAEAAQIEAAFEASRKENQTGDLQSAEARLSEEVGATLISPSLVVTPLTPERQFVSRIEPTEWRWAVTGSAEGQHELSLSLYAILPERSSVRVLKTYDRTITVQVPKEQRVIRFVKGHWEWLWSIALAPLGAWALAWWRRRRLQGETG